MLSAGELHERALRASNAGRHGLARRLLLTAAARDPDGDVAARVALSLAYLDAEHGALADGLRRCEEALMVPGASPATRGLVESQRGLLLMRAGDIEGAVTALGAAERLLRRGGDAQARARLHLNRGNAHLQAGRLGAARADFEQCAELVGDVAPLTAARARHNLGYVHLLRGELVEALCCMDAARPVLEPVSVVSRAVAAQDRAEVLLAAGLVDEALVALGDAVGCFGDRGMRQQQGEAELVLARTLVATGRRREARAVAHRAAARFRRRGATAWALRAELVGLDADDTDPAVVADRLQDVAGRLESARLPTEAAVARQAASRALVRAGDLSAAATLAGRDGSRATSAPLLRIGAQLVRAELAAAEGSTVVARRHLRRGLDELQRWQSTFGSLDVRTALSGHGRDLALLGLRSALADGRPAVVLEWAERARAMASRVTSLRPPSDPRLADDLAAMRALGDADPERAARLAEQVRARAWQGSGAGSLTPPATLDEVRAALAPHGGTFVAHLVVDGRLAALVVTARGARVHRLGTMDDVRPLLAGLQADLDVAASLLPARLRSVVLTALRQRLGRLAAILWEPLAVPADAPVVLVPSGALAPVPWSCLPGLTARPVTVARSGAAWLRARPGAAPARVGLVAGPRVARAEEEVARAAASWPGASTLVGAAATASEVSAMACDVDLLHVAAHGRHTASSPLFSQLELADGPWHGYDIDLLERPPRLVVLSSCELGRSAVRWGAETIGTTVAWQHAGTACVIAAPARVADDVACEVLAATHVALAAGRSPAEALAAAGGVVGADAVVPFTCFGAGW